MPVAMWREVWTLLWFSLVGFFLPNLGVRSLIIGMILQTTMVAFGLWMSNQLKISKKIQLSLIIPLAYVLFLAVALVEYCAGFESLIKMPKLKKSMTKKHATWVSPTRM